MRSIVFIFLIPIALPLLAQTVKPEWIADSKTGCKVWNASPKPKDTISWSGDCKIGLAQGRGVLQWFLDGKHGNRYEGEYRGGQANGWGVYTYIDGSHYDGEFKDNKVNGTGVLVVGGETYSGTWTNGCFREGDQIAVIGTTRKECGFE